MGQLPTVNSPNPSSVDERTVTRIESIEDEMRGIATYELPNGRRVSLDLATVREFGARWVLREIGLGDFIPTERIPVIWNGEKVGTFPPEFDPISIKSKSYFYDPRAGDFRREGSAWIAAKNLGPGDLESIPGFIWDREHP